MLTSQRLAPSPVVVGMRHVLHVGSYWRRVVQDLFSQTLDSIILLFPNIRQYNTSLPESQTRTTSSTFSSCSLLVDYSSSCRCCAIYYSPINNIFRPVLLVHGEKKTTRTEDVGCHNHKRLIFRIQAKCSRVVASGEGRNPSTQNANRSSLLLWAFPDQDTTARLALEEEIQSFISSVFLKLFLLFVTK